MSTYRPEEQPSVKDEFEETKQDNNEFNLTPSRLSEELRLNSQKLQQLGSIIEWKDRRIARLEDAIRKLEVKIVKDEDFVIYLLCFFRKFVSSEIHCMKCLMISGLSLLLLC